MFDQTELAATEIVADATTAEAWSADNEPVSPVESTFTMPAWQPVVAELHDNAGPVRRSWWLTNAIAAGILAAAAIPGVTFAIAAALTATPTTGAPTMPVVAASSTSTEPVSTVAPAATVTTTVTRGPTTTVAAAPTARTTPTKPPPTATPQDKYFQDLSDVWGIVPPDKQAALEFGNRACAIMATNHHDVGSAATALVGKNASYSDWDNALSYVVAAGDALCP